MAADPETWGPIVAAQPACHRRKGDPPETLPGAPRPPREEPPLPSLGRALSGLAGTARDVIVHAVRHGGLFWATAVVKAERDATCQHGEGLAADQVVDGHCSFYRVSDGRCGGREGCSCVMTIKSHLAAAKCPLGRWRR